MAWAAAAARQSCSDGLRVGVVAECKGAWYCLTLQANFGQRPASLTSRYLTDRQIPHTGSTRHSSATAVHLQLDYVTSRSFCLSCPLTLTSALQAAGVQGDPCIRVHHLYSHVGSSGQHHMPISLTYHKLHHLQPILQVEQIAQQLCVPYICL